MNTFGERLRIGIEMLGLKIIEASEKSGIPYRSLQNYLHGDRDPKADALAQISAGLGISADWLLTGEGSPLRDRGRGELAQAESLNPEEAAVLALYRALDGDARREIHTVAEEKKRLREVERQLRAVQAELAGRKRSA